MEEQPSNSYLRHIKCLKEDLYSNEVQVNIAVNTKRYLDTNYDQKINLEMLARLRFTSKYHLIRMFKKYYGTTPRQYLINKRIEMARQRLRAGETVAEACYSVGFDSISSFSNLFRAKMGMPPSAYRKATFDKSSE